MLWLFPIFYFYIICLYIIIDACLNKYSNWLWMDGVKFSQYILLHNSETGVGQRVPISNFVVQTIDDDGIAAIVRANQAESLKQLLRQQNEKSVLPA